MEEFLKISGISTHNLKGFDLTIPLKKLVVITGPSGSGKSSLAFYTIGKKGENLLKNFLNYDKEIFEEPVSAEFLSPLPPTVTLSQGVKNWYPFKQVGEFLGIKRFITELFLKQGEFLCPSCGAYNRFSRISEVINHFLSLPEGTKLYFLIPLGKEVSKKAIDYLVSQGFVKFLIETQEIDLSEESFPYNFPKKDIFLILDRLIKREKRVERLLEDIRLSKEINGGRFILKPVEEIGKEFNLGRHCINCGRLLKIKGFERCEVCNGRGYLSEKERCPECEGLKLKPHILSSKIGDFKIREILSLSLSSFERWLKENKVKLNLPQEIVETFSKRIQIAREFSIEELKVSTPVFKLSLGERKLLEMLLIFSFETKGVLYVLDEPTLGLNWERREKLADFLKKLTEKNSVVVVEHDPYFVSRADFVIKLGPSGGEKGGYLLYAGKFQDALFKEEVENLKDLFRELSFLTEENSIKAHSFENFEFLEGGINFFTGNFTGKTDLSLETSFEKLKSELSEKNKNFLDIEKSFSLREKDLVITFSGLWERIREYLLNLPEVKAKGLTRRHLSLFTKEGVCPFCHGKGPCEECFGKKFHPEVLKIKVKGMTLFDFLELTIEEVIPFFERVFSIKSFAKSLVEMGLGYLKLSQEARTLSGGEKIRLFLAKKLENLKDSCFIFLNYPFQGLGIREIFLFLKWLLKNFGGKHTFFIVETHPVIYLLPERIKGVKVIDQDGEKVLKKFEKSSIGTVYKTLLA